MPLALSVSKTPLWVKMTLTKQFPTQKPIFTMFAKVRHPSIDAHMMIKDPIIENWSANSNLLQVVRYMHAKFEQNPPLPAELAEREDKKQEEVKEFVKDKIIKKKTML